jgi:DNA-binding response OmpR family regulator
VESRAIHALTARPQTAKAASDFALRTFVNFILGSSCQVRRTCASEFHLTPHPEFGPFRLDVDGRMLFRGSTPVQVAPKAIDMLIVLVEDVRAVIDKEEILKRVWKDAFVEEGSLTRCVSLNASFTYLRLVSKKRESRLLKRLIRRCC